MQAQGQVLAPFGGILGIMLKQLPKLLTTHLGSMRGARRYDLGIMQDSSTPLGV